MNLKEFAAHIKTEFGPEAAYIAICPGADGDYMLKVYTDEGPAVADFDTHSDSWRDACKQDDALGAELTALGVVVCGDLSELLERLEGP